AGARCSSSTTSSTASRRARSSSRWTRCASRRAWRTRRPPSPPTQASTAPPTPKSAMRSSSCSRARCRPPPRSSTSSWPRCCGIISSSSGRTATPYDPPMRLSADALNRFGEALGRELGAPAVIGLSGELGTGKTTFVQAICRGVGARGLATSPTYALVHQYRTPQGRLVYHVDCYRLRSPAEAQDLGFDDMVRDEPIVLIEWPERAGAWVPRLDRHFRLSYGDEADTRELEEIR